MKIDILCTSDDHPVNSWLAMWSQKQSRDHVVTVIRGKDQMKAGDLLFLISCSEIIPADLRRLYKNCVVLHASDLPKGRGWSPHIWAILEGATAITVTAINAEDRVDSGDVWAKATFEVASHELYDEINKSLFEAEVALMDEVIAMLESGRLPSPQSDEEVSYFPRRNPQDSEIDPAKSISEQFNQLRISDPDRYPAFFKLYGETYEIRLKKV